MSSQRITHRHKRSLAQLMVFLLVFMQTAQAGNYIAFIHTDVLGSPVAVTDQNGNIVSREHVSPYGDSLGKRSEDDTTPIGSSEHGIGYTGHVKDKDLGLTYMQARYYDPTIGRFMGTDPVTFKATNPALFNRYSYANNNPYKYVDPDGRAVFAPLAAPTAVKTLGWAVGIVTAALGFGAAVENIGPMRSEEVAPPDPDTIDEIDPSDKNGELTRGARAIDKHGSTSGKRAGDNSFPAPKGNPDNRARQGRDELDDIMNDPEGHTESGPDANRWGGTRVHDSIGRSADFDKEGTFRGFRGTKSDSGSDGTEGSDGGNGSGNTTSEYENSE